MTSFRIEPGALAPRQLDTWSDLSAEFRNWPVVYALDGPKQIYVGESNDAVARLRQHLKDPAKAGLKGARVILDLTFNKSVCLDLESYLIEHFHADATYEVINGNFGSVDRNYYRRADYREVFDEIFEVLRSDGLFSNSLPAIENSDLFKLSPFKRLTAEQQAAVGNILDGLFADLEEGVPSTSVVMGQPGTGKTVVAIFLMKMLADVKSGRTDDPGDADSPLAEFFVDDYRRALAGFRMGFVVPQKSLRKTVKRVFRRTPGLDPAMVLTPFEVGNDPDAYDMLIVDEAHRLRHGGNHPIGVLYRDFRMINQRLFGRDDAGLTQLDWVKARSTHQIFLLDAAQSIHTGDVSQSVLDNLRSSAERHDRLYRLASQMRVRAGDDYVGYIRAILSDAPPEARRFPGYDLRFFDDVEAMRQAIVERDAEVGLARMVAGFAWPWASKKDSTAYDIDINGTQLRWNTRDEDWVSSPNALHEVGCIHTIQGYDLNYAGVIIGPDLRWDPANERMVFDRAKYQDPSAGKNAPALGLTFTDADLLALVENIYAVLLTRGILGTYVYVVDRELRQHLETYLNTAGPTPPTGTEQTSI